MRDMGDLWLSLTLKQMWRALNLISEVLLGKMWGGWTFPNGPLDIFLI